MADSGPAADLRDWILIQGRRFADPGGLLSELAGRLIDLGVPIDRTTLHLPALHPQLYALGYVWLADTGAAEERQLPRSVPLSSSYFNSPVGMLHRMGETIRRRLDGPADEFDFPVLEDLASEGYTDYVILPLEIGRPTVSGFGMMTKHSDGFSDAHIALAESLLTPLAAVVELYVSRRTAVGLLDAYVGRKAGRRVLNGEVVIGSGRSIDAILLFTDIRGFTQLSETLDRQPLLDLLSDYFGAIIGPLDKAGGEVLKFLGDGLLAIFNLDQETDTEEACARAMIAAFEANREVERINQARAADGRAQFACGIALHRGSVIYGNIGAGDRLDFTVIGPAVNRAARIESMTRALEQPILSSRAFARVCPVELVSLGKFELRGIDKPQELFAPGAHLAPDDPQEPAYATAAS
jgi:adenylate cyclase